MMRKATFLVRLLCDLTFRVLTASLLDRLKYFYGNVFGRWFACRVQRR
jgi:hypothetical protein